MLDHEYSVVGHSRASIGRYLSIASATLASIFSIMGALWLQFAVYLGLPNWVNFLAIPLTGGVIYVTVHWIFNKWCWKLFFHFTGLPDISGEWKCEGQSFDAEKQPSYKWNAKITVTQSWEKISVYLRTEQSASNSVSAALIPQGGGRWLLMYSYRNQPRAGEPINSHLGYSEMTFEAGYKKAEGDYFTALGRTTCGRMTWTRGA